MQNKANLGGAKIYTTSLSTNIYGKIIVLRGQENKADLKQTQDNRHKTQGKKVEKTNPIRLRL
jgi:plasmid maintenance system killer protein